MTTASLDTYRAADAGLHAGFVDSQANEAPRSLLSDMEHPFPPYEILDLGGMKPTPQQDSNRLNTAMFRQGANQAPACTSFAFKVSISQLDAFISDMAGFAVETPGLNRDLDPEVSGAVQTGAQLFLFPPDSAALDTTPNRRETDLDDCRRLANMNFGLVELWWSDAARNQEHRFFANPLGIRPVGVASTPDRGNWPQVASQLGGFNQYVPMCGPYRERALIVGGFASDTVRCESDWLSVRVTELRVRFSNTPPFQRPGDPGWVNEFVNGLV